MENNTDFLAYSDLDPEAPLHSCNNNDCTATCIYCNQDFCVETTEHVILLDGSAVCWACEDKNTPPNAA